MSGPPPPDLIDLAHKIARLVEERGWNQEDFARITNLNRQTVRQILLQGGKRPRAATISRCAKALGLSILELRTLSLEQLVARVHGPRQPDGTPQLQRLHEQATQPQLVSWLERNPERAKQLTPEEIDELLSLQGTGGPLTLFGVEHYIEQLERRRRLVERVTLIAGTEYVDLLEKLVGLIYDKVQPYADRK